jgi:hypothetical protein
MFLGSRARSVRKAISFTAICQRILETMLDPRYFISVEPSVACFEDSFTLPTLRIYRVRQANFLFYMNIFI